MAKLRSGVGAKIMADKLLPCRGFQDCIHNYMVRVMTSYLGSVAFWEEYAVWRKLCGDGYVALIRDHPYLTRDAKQSILQPLSVRSD
ncbi:hypothetical protein LCGC14_2622760 [marine sediment metagenome]|uniref:Uncharacterized protein n=1 Tax=marine sediment metagenome TaxID=412755 RepID=A0A0F9CV82_9ZZZZ